jgi:hypothetical protein
MEVRVANAFIAAGVSSIRVREAIALAREVLGVDRPLSTDRFRTDGRDIFLRVVETQSGEERERLLSLIKRQYSFAEILAPSLKGIEFDEGGALTLWRPLGKRSVVILDPERAFGQPIDEASGVPTRALANAAWVEGEAGAAVVFDVPVSVVRQALAFERDIENRKAA